jgi:hypothetical protein
MGDQRERVCVRVRPQDQEAHAGALIFPRVRLRPQFPIIALQVTSPSAASLAYHALFG